MLMTTRCGNFHRILRGIAHWIMLIITQFAPSCKAILEMSDKNLPIRHISAFSHFGFALFPGSVITVERRL